MLKDIQIKAISMILAGRKMIDIASELKINRETIWQWKKSDPEFIAAYNREKNAVIMGVREEVLSLVSKAIDTLKENMTVREAMEILKLCFNGEFTRIEESDQTDTDELNKKYFSQKLYDVIKELKKAGKTKQEAKEAIQYKKMNGYQKSVFDENWAENFETDILNFHSVSVDAD